MTDERSLRQANPEIAAQADGWDPTTVSPFSHRMVSWRCPLGHRWDATVASRSSGGGCPYCSGRRVLKGFNDLATTHPEVAAEADGWDPTTVVAHSNMKVNWKCAVGHRWSAWIGNRSRGSGCPVCSGRQVHAGFNDFATHRPDLVPEADGWDPSTVTSGTTRKMGWRCKRGHRWTAAVAERSSGKGCPVCANRVVLVGFNDLATTHPELAAEADGWDPTTVVGGSGKKLDWRCRHEHRWSATVENRSNGTGCPVCANRVVLVGFNDLATTHPELAAEADGWEPTTVVAHSNKRVKWRCRRGHDWTAVIASRTSGNGCPVCSRRVVDPGVTDLATTDPELAAEADGWDPRTLSAFSNMKVGWMCRRGHKWMANVASRSRGNGCPVCAGKVVEAGVNDLRSVNPELAAQADGWDPTQVSAHSHAKVAWKCAVGHRWTATIKNRSRSPGCPVCSHKRLEVGFNDLATTHPELAAEADGWDPRTVFANTDRVLAWKCANQHKWKASGNNRAQGRGCPVCAGRQVVQGFNDLATTRPDVASQWHPNKNNGLQPSEVSQGSSRIVWWNCPVEADHEWKASIVNRTTPGVETGCAVCAGRVVVASNCLATLFPNVASEWHPTRNGPVTPSKVTPYVTRKAWWVCTAGHEWHAAISSRTTGKTGCPMCAGKVAIPGETDLLTTHPSIAAEWHPTKNGAFLPSELKAGSNRPIWWLCKHAHEWRTAPASRALGGSACPYCAGQRPIVGINDLATSRPDLASEWHPTKNGKLNPQDVMGGTSRKVWWQCEEGHEWAAPPASRSAGSGCPSCASTGFNPSKQGWLYFLRHPDWTMLQIGISNNVEARLQTHFRLGWELIEVRGPMDGAQAAGIERAALQALKSRGAKLGKRGGESNFDGFTEAWHEQSLPIRSVKQLLDLIHEDEWPSREALHSS